MNSDRAICYGDIVYLEGIINYSTQQRLSDFYERNLLWTDTVFTKRSCVLIRKSDPEFKNISQFLYQIVNVSELSPLGSPVRFGSSFLLQPIKAHRYSAFLSVNERDRACIETDAHKLDTKSTIEFSDPYHEVSCQFRFKATSSFRSSGVVYYSDVVNIQSVFNSNLYIHIGDTKSSYGSIDISYVEKGFSCQLEVNASQKTDDSNRGSFNWKIHLYDRLNQKYSERSSFRIGSTFRLLQTASGKYLSGSSKSVNRDSSLLPNEKFLVLKSPYLIRYDEDEILSSKSIFMAEAVDGVLIGGVIAYHQKIRLRHVLSGGYLCVSLDESNPLIGPKLRLAKLPKYSSQVTIDEFIAKTTCKFINVTDIRDKSVIASTEAVSYVCFSLLIDQGTQYERSIDFILSRGGNVVPHCKLYPDITTDVQGPLIRYLQDNEEAKVGFNKSRCKLLSTEASSQSASLIVTREFDDDDPPEEVLSSHELLKSSSFAICPASDTENHLLSAIQDSQPVLNDFEFIIMGQYARNIRGSSLNDVIIRADSVQQIYATLFSVREFLDGRFDYLFDNATTAKSVKFQIRRNDDTLLTDSQKKKKRHRNQIFIKDTGMIRRWFMLIRLPRMLGVPWNKLLQNQTLKELFVALYDAIASAVKENTKVQHHVARGRYEHSEISLALPKNFGINLTTLSTHASKGYLRELFDQLRLHLGGVNIIKSVITEDYLIFINLVNDKLINFISSRLLDGRRFLLSKLIPEEAPIPMGEENLHTMYLLTNMLSSNGHYCPQNQQLVLENVYKAKKMEFFISSCLHEVSGMIPDDSLDNLDHEEVAERKLSNSQRSALWLPENQVTVPHSRRSSKTSLPKDIFITWSGLQLQQDVKMSSFLRFGVESYCHDNGFVHTIDGSAAAKSYLKSFQQWLDQLDTLASDDYVGRRESAPSYTTIDSDDDVIIRNTISFGVDRASSSMSSPKAGKKERPKFEKEKAATQSYWIRLSDVLEVINASAPVASAASTSLNYTSTPRTHGVKEKESVRQRFEMLLKNYQTSLELFASLCENRNYESILKISEEYPYELLLHAISNNQYPLSLRSQFAKLMRVLYIDRFPYVDLKLPTPYILSTSFNQPFPIATLDSMISWFKSQDGKYCNTIQEDISNAKPRMESLQSVLANYFSEYFLVGLEDIGDTSPSILSGVTGVNSDDVTVPAGFSFVTCTHSLTQLLKLIIRSGNYTHHQQFVKILRIASEVIKSQTKSASNDAAAPSLNAFLELKDKKDKIMKTVHTNSSNRAFRRRSSMEGYSLVMHDDEVDNNDKDDEEEDDDDDDDGYDTVEDVSKERLRFLCKAHDLASSGVNTTVAVHITERLVRDEATSSWIPSQYDSSSVRYATKDDYLTKAFINDPSFDVSRHRSYSNQRDHFGLPDLTWEWKDEWQLTVNDSFKQEKDKIRMWVRHRYRRNPWDIADDLHHRGHSWYSIVNSFKLCTNSEDIIDLRKAVVNLNEAGSATDIVVSDVSGSSLEYVEKVLSAQHFRDVDKNQLVGSYLETCLNIIISVYDIIMQIQSTALTKNLYNLYLSKRLTDINEHCYVSKDATGSLTLTSETFDVLKKIMFDDTTSQVDVLKVTSNSFLVSMFSLVMEDDHNRCQTALFLIRRHFFKRKLFVNHVCRLKIVDIQSSKGFDQIRSLQLRLENYSSILFNTADFSKSRFDTLISLMQALRERLTDTSVLFDIFVRSNNAVYDANFTRKQYTQLYQLMGITHYMMTFVVSCYQVIGSLHDSSERENCQKLCMFATDFIVELLAETPVADRYPLMSFMDDLIDNFSKNLGAIRIVKAMVTNNRWMVYNSPLKKLMSEIFRVLSSAKDGVVCSVTDFRYYWLVSQDYIFLGKPNVYGIWENVKSSFDSHTTAQLYYVSIFFSKQLKILRNALPGGESFSMSKYVGDLELYAAGNGGKLLVYTSTKGSSLVDNLEEADEQKNQELSEECISKAKFAEDRLDYIACLLKTLGLSCIGGVVDQVTVAGNKSRCRDEIPIIDVFQMLDSALVYRHLSLIKGIIVYLYSVYLEGPAKLSTENIKEFANFLGLWTTVKKMLDVSQLFVLNRKHNISDSSYGMTLEVLVVEYILPFCSIIFSAIETAPMIGDEYEVRFNGYNALKIRLFHILEIVCMRNDDLIKSPSSYEELKSILLDIQPSIEHDSGHSWTLDVNLKSDRHKPIAVDMSGAGSSVVANGGSQKSSNSFIDEFSVFQGSLTNHPIIKEKFENDSDELLSAVMLEVGLMSFDPTTQKTHVLIGHHSFEDSDSKKYSLLHRLIRFAREEIQLKLSTWPKGEKRRQAIKPGDNHPEIQCVQMIFDILSGLVQKFRDADGLKQLTFGFKSLHHKYFESSGRIIKVVDILINANVLNLIVETLANCCYKDLVFRAIRLCNTLSLCGSKGRVQHHLFLCLIGKSRTVTSKENSLSFESLSQEDTKLFEDFEFDETAKLFFECLHDRIFLASYIRKLANDSLQEQLDQAMSNASNKLLEIQELNAKNVSGRSMIRQASSVSGSSLTKESEPSSGSSKANRKDSTLEVTTSSLSKRPSIRISETSPSLSAAPAKKRDVIVNGINAATHNAEFMDSGTGIFGVLILLKFLCSNSYLPFQSAMNNEDGKFTFSLISDAVDFLHIMLPSPLHLRVIREKDLELILLCLHFIIHSISGPNTKNQRFLLTTSIFTIFKRILEFPLESSGVAVITDDGKDFTDKYAMLVNLRRAAMTMIMTFVEGRLATPYCSIFRSLNESLSLGIFSRRLYELHEHATKHIFALSTKNCWSPMQVTEAMEWLVDEAYPILALHRYVSDYDPTVLQKIEPLSSKVLSSIYKDIFSGKEKRDRALSRNRYRDESRYYHVYHYYNSRLRSVEVRWTNDHLVRIYYRIPEKCLLLSSDDYTDVKDELNFGDEDRIAKLFSFVDDINNKANHYLYLKHSRYFQYIFLFEKEVDTLRLIVSIIINVVLTFAVRKGGSHGDDDHSTHESTTTEFEPYGYEVLLEILVIIQFLLSAGRFVQSLILRLPVLYNIPYTAYEADADHLKPRPGRQLKRSSLSVSSDKTDKESSGTGSDMIDTIGSNQSDTVTFHTLLSHFSSVIWLILACILLHGLIFGEYHVLPGRLATFCGVLTGVWFLYRLRVFGQYLSKLSSPIYQRLLHYYCVFIDTIFDGSVKYKFALFVVSVICLDMDLFFFNPIMLFIVVKMSITLQNVLKAVALCGNQLLMILIFLLIALLVFTMFGYAYLYDEFYHGDHNTCNNMLECLTTFFYNGVMSIDGIKAYFVEIGSELDPSRPTAYANQIIFGFLFFATINVLIFNSILGTIVETFGSVRDAAKEQEHFKKFYCFVCNLSKDSFNLLTLNSHDSDSRKDSKEIQTIPRGSKVKTFNQHIFDDHNMWNYLFLLIYLHEKPEHQLNNVERYILKLWKDGDFGWLPRTETLFVVSDGIKRKGVGSEQESRSSKSEK